MEEETIDSPEPASPKSEENRFSLLPNALIHHILSFVDDMRITVQMSILSNRWRHIWKSLPALTFRYDPIVSNGFFRDFVNTALMLREDIDLHSLTVVWIDPLNTDIDIADALNTWVLYAVKRKVKKLVFVIGVNKSQSFEFPECVFNCESLTNLRLYLGSMYRSTLCLPESIHLPNLKYLKFEALHLYEDLMTDFFTRCPALESVTINNCIMGDLQIVSHSLKHFTMLYSSFNATVSEVANSVLLFAPNLEVFDIKCHPSQLFGLFLKSLVKADVEMVVQEKRNNPYTYSELAGEAKDMYAKAMMIMLEKFHNVKDLTLSSRFIQIISRSPDLLKTKPPQLPHLRRMELRTYLSKDCAQAILYLLRISPKIESLSVRIDKDCFAEQPTGLYCNEINFPSENIEEYWKPGLTSRYEPLHLKVVELVDVNGSVDELRFIEVFLKYAVRLEKLVLYWNWDGSDNLMDRVMKFDEKLRSLPKASSRVSTLFY
ncbi:hypothetical protein MKW98_005623 [Papaver atlanticum]|uniref:FBD domain-containing protein n=1 Tax=Papaver atlanticum TaxID=357466 RepID=A0AAD4SSD4_9MAGN|nr:hypothetical protein MKW98_005623 [Papaver atlanticum]